MMPRSPACSGSRFSMEAPASRNALKVPIKLMAMTRSKSANGIGPSGPAKALGGPQPGAVVRSAGDAVIGLGLGEGRFGRGAVGDVAGDRDAVDVDRHFGGGFMVDVEDRH